MIKPVFNRTTRRLVLQASTAADKRALATMAWEMTQRGVQYSLRGDFALELPLWQSLLLQEMAAAVKGAE